MAGCSKKIKQLSDGLLSAGLPQLRGGEGGMEEEEERIVISAYANKRLSRARAPTSNEVQFKVAWQKMYRFDNLSSSRPPEITSDLGREGAATARAL